MRSFLDALLTGWAESTEVRMKNLSNYDVGSINSVQFVVTQLPAVDGIRPLGGAPIVNTRFTIDGTYFRFVLLKGYEPCRTEK